ncbi:MAG: C39 family peptidase [Clostridia bacterium]|nr:C39 family peptidase [Clostridia bacterium]
MNPIFYEPSLEKGTHLNTVFENQTLVLKEDFELGLFTSEEIYTDTFSKLVMSWNASTEADTSIEISVRVFEEVWSEWMSYGIWTSEGLNKGSARISENAIAKMNIDEVKCRRLCKGYQFRVALKREDCSLKKPILKKIFISCAVEKTTELTRVINTDIEVPQYSQKEIPDIGHVICSPTSLAMVMNYYGVQVNILDVAKGVFDHGAGIYGNWSYNIAYAGEKNLTSILAYCYDVNILMTYIKSGIPLVASIKTQSVEELKGSPQAYPSGHLLVIRGFEFDQESYIVVNDPAVESSDFVKRKYKLEEFLKVWNNIIYIIYKEYI